MSGKQRKNITPLVNIHCKLSLCSIK